jgi:hypothetical protein
MKKYSYKKITIFFYLVLSFCQASFGYVENPEKNFSTKKNMVDESKIRWTPVKNIQATCEAESRKRKFGGFGYAVEACSFWDKDDEGNNICSIYTKVSTNMHTLGHEVRHCFQGKWHK